MIPAEARAEIDVRVVTVAEAERITRLATILQPDNSEATVEIIGGLRYPPMERTKATADLFARAQVIAQRLGFTIDEVSSGGASDGNFCSAMGVPVLDGLGPVGGGAHASNEYVTVSDMPRRAALVGLLLQSFEMAV
jgi:glutamate carboxypeptidase